MLTVVTRAGQRPRPFAVPPPAAAPLVDVVEAQLAAIAAAADGRPLCAAETPPRALYAGGVEPSELPVGAVRVATGGRLPEERYDVVVVGHDELARADDPAARLRALGARVDDGGTLIVDLAPPDLADLVQRTVTGDLSDDDDGALAQPLRHATPPSLFKLLLDEGWMPNAEHVEHREPNGDDDAPTLALGRTLGLPASTAARRLGLRRMVVGARRLFDDAPSTDAAEGRFDVVVPTTRESQFRVDVERSPGLAEVDARLISVRDAATPAQALDAAADHLRSDWVLLCHQDVYLPRGFGRRLQAVLAGVPAADRPATLIGFAGIAADAARGRFVPSGFVVDRRARFDHPASDHATSLDELAIVVARDSLHRIDPTLGWHLWATDLCLHSVCELRRFARIVRLPLMHNSWADAQLPTGFHASAKRLAAKHAAFGPVTTLCGTVSVDGDVRFQGFE